MRPARFPLFHLHHGRGLLFSGHGGNAVQRTCVLGSISAERGAKRWDKAVLIYGAGAAGSMLGKEIRSNAKLKTRIVGFLDDDECKQGSSLLGMPILGPGAEAARVVARLSHERTCVSEVIIAMPSATAREMRVAISHCRAAGVPFKTLPSLSELLSGNITPQIRAVSPNDLLGREPVLIDEPESVKPLPENRFWSPAGVVRLAPSCAGKWRVLLLTSW